MDHFDLGEYRRSITTNSPQAQRWFDIGLNWCYGFNQEEGQKCFERALEHDPDCAMAWWGIAYAAGPFYNLSWKEHGPEEARRAAATCFRASREALKRADRATAVERTLIEALMVRHPLLQPPTLDEIAVWDDAYADAMRAAYQAFPDDHDVMALLVEALMMRTVRRLWDLRTGLPANGSAVVEALDVCERSIALADKHRVAQHPTILHLHIHLMEMSSEPERALHSADGLNGLCPDAGHMNHMPAHIYVLVGDYEKAQKVSEDAIRADDMYRAYCETKNNYLLACCHDLHLMMFTCMFLGQFRPALAAADKVRSLVTRDVVTIPDRPKLTQTVEGYYAMRSHVLVRFGRWQEIIDEPDTREPELYPVTAAMQRYAKGVAYATQRNFSAARDQRSLLLESIESIGPQRRFLSNPTQASLAVGVALLDGELAFHEGRFDEAFDSLRRAVELDDNLSYTEPWAWMHPPRHALAALLLERGHVEEAERVYRDDLGLTPGIQRCAQHPDNVWALHGLVECLRRRGAADDLPDFEAKLARAQTLTDMLVTASYLCRTATVAGACCH
jgi:tetratricopeptide (TPR) repeat protein